MKSYNRQLLAVLVFLGGSEIFSFQSSLAVSAMIILLAGLTGAGLGVCESLLQSRRPARVVVTRRSRD